MTKSVRKCWKHDVEFKKRNVIKFLEYTHTHAYTHVYMHISYKNDWKENHEDINHVNCWVGVRVIFHHLPHCFLNVIWISSPSAHTWIDQRSNWSKWPAIYGRASVQSCVQVEFLAEYIRLALNPLNRETGMWKERPRSRKELCASHIKPQHKQ